MDLDILFVAGMKVMKAEPVDLIFLIFSMIAIKITIISQNNPCVS